MFLPNKRKLEKKIHHEHQMKNSLVLSSLILGISIMGSVFIYKTVTPSVKVPKPTINSSTTKKEYGDFQWKDIDVKWIFKYKYFNGGLNYIIELENIDGVSSVFFGPGFITITKSENIDWDAINQDIVDIFDKL